MQAPELSICIATHDGRAATLRVALQSILTQLDGEQVEVCVSDGGSTDGTAEVIADLQTRRSGWLSYKRTEIDGGFAHHLLDAMHMARGSYCWMFSSDDAIEPGGIELVRAALRSQPDLIGLSCSVAMYTNDLERLVTRDPQFFYPRDPDRPHRYTGAAAITAELGVIFAYVAAHVVRRDAWQAGLAEQLASGRQPSTYFPHMDVFARMIKTGGAWAWLPDRVIRNRGGNDSWTPRVFGGDVSRYWIAILADLSRLYGKLAPGQPAVRRRLMTTWIDTVAKAEDLTRYREAPGGGLHRDLMMLIGFTRALWRYPAFWRRSLPTLLTPRGRLSPVVAGEPI